MVSLQPAGGVHRPVPVATDKGQAIAHLAAGRVVAGADDREAIADVEDAIPVLQPDPALQESDVVDEYQAALAAGDADAIVAAFEADGYAREPAGCEYVHSGPGGLRAFCEQLF